MFEKILIDQKHELIERINKTRIVERDNISKAKHFVKSKMVKVIIGPRRAGKSFFTYQLLMDKDFAYANFDESVLINQTHNKLMDIFYENYGNFTYIFLDEIQNLSEWELLINKIHRRGLNVFITGSNSRLLSKELATFLTGRHLQIEILPFSFNEFLKARNINLDTETTKGIAVIKKALNEYITSTGYPEVVVENEEARYYLKQLFDDIVTKDIILRYRIRYDRTFREIAHVLVSNIASFISFNRIKNDFKLGSEHTAKSYLYYLNESYLTLMINRFSFKPKEIEKSEKKIYTIDQGFYNFIGFKHSKNIGKIYENTVAVELKRRVDNFDYDVFYYKTISGHEVDFVVKKGQMVQQLIQVCYHIDDTRTKNREIRALLHASKNLKCNNLLIITHDYENTETVEWFGIKRKIKFIPLWKWLLNLN